MEISGRTGEIISGMLDMMLESFVEVVLLIPFVLGGMYMVYFLSNPKRAIARLRHDSRICLQCQALKSVARGLGCGDEYLDTSAVGRFARLADRRRLNGYLEVRFYRGICTVSFSLDWITHTASYDANKDVPDGGEEVAQPPAA